MSENEGPNLSPTQQAYPKYPADGYITVKEYAKHRGCSDVNVRIRMREGKLEGAFFKDELGRVNVDKEKADIEWAKWETDRTVMQKNRRAREAGKTYDGEGFQGYKDPDEHSSDPSNDASILQAKRKSEWLKVEHSQMELDRKRGVLIPADSVQKELFEMARMVRSNMLALPDRLASKLAAERDEKKVHKELMREIRKALEDLRADISEVMSHDDEE